MTINTQYIQKVKPSDVKVPMFKFEDFEYKSTFDFKTEAPKDKFSTKTLWDDEIKALLMNSMKKFHCGRMNILDSSYFIYIYISNERIKQDI